MSTYLVPHTELAAAKLKRKSMDKEAQILQNKILLLKHAEDQALRINEKKKRKDMLDTEAQLNKLEKLEKREEIKKVKEQETLKKIQLAQKNREKNKSCKNTIYQFLYSRAQSEAQLLKNDRQKNQKLIMDMKKNELQEKQILSSQVRNSVKVAQERRKKILDEKVNKIRSETRMKIQEEFKKIKEKENKLEKLEKEQLKLIERLNQVRNLTPSEEEEEVSFKFKSS